MAVFQIPQFIDMEDKVVGPLTLKQFSFIAAAFLSALGLFYILELWLWLILATLVASLGASLAFLKVNGRDLASYLVSMFLFYWYPHRYFWQHQVASASLNLVPESVQDIKDLPKIKSAAATVTITRKPTFKPTNLTTGTGLKNLFEKMMTTKNVIPNRERPGVLIRGQQSKYSVLENATGERTTAKRVDYR